MNKKRLLNSSNVYFMKNKYPNKQITYNTQGNIIINDNFASKNIENFNNINDNNIDLNDINENINNINDNINNDINDINDNIDNNDNGNNIDNEIMDIPEYVLPKYKGKTIVLVDSENPWYLNYDTTIPIPYSQELNLTTKQYRNEADFGSHENLEFEHFNDNSNNNNDSVLQNQIIFLLLIFIIILYIYKKMNYFNNIISS